MKKTTAKIQYALLMLLLIMLGCGGERPAPPPASPADTTVRHTAPANTTAAATVWTADIVERSSSQARPSLLTAARAGRHEDFDRVVFVFEERVPGYHLEYIDRPVRACGSGKPVPLAGEGWLEVHFHPARAHTVDGTPTVGVRERTPALPVLKELELTCDFEGYVTWVLGLASPNRYRVDTLANPPRLVVDVRQR